MYICLPEVMPLLSDEDKKEIQAVMKYYTGLDYDDNGYTDYMFDYIKPDYRLPHLSDKEKQMYPEDR